MVEIIPAIIAKSFDELKAKIKLVESSVKTVQLDVMDGVFVDNKTWPYTEYNCHPELVSGSGNSEEMPKQVRHDKNRAFSDDINNLKTDIFLEAHLMVENPHRILNEWLNTKVGRIILHWEAIKEIFNLAEQIHNSGKQFGVALNPETPIEVLDNFINDIDLVLLMSVDPGFAGQEFKKAVIPKIIALRQLYPDAKIEVDGGIDPQNILKLVGAGADFLVMGSAIFGSSDPQAVIRETYEEINKK